MIAESLAYFLDNAAELQALGSSFHAFAQTPDTVLGELRAPYALVTPHDDAAEELWAIGDTQRQLRPRFQVSFYGTTFEMATQFKARFARLIQSAKALDDRGLLIPGIDFRAFADLLLDSGDHLTYASNQPGWFASPAPVVYKNEDSNGEPVVVASGYTLNRTAGTVTFSIANSASDKIRAAYKIGVIDFSVLGVANFTSAAVEGVDSNPERYAVAFDLEAFYYVKTNANRWL